MCKLRCVEFTLEGSNLYADSDLGFYDQTEGEREKSTAKRKGYFHCLGNIINTENIPVTVAFVEYENRIYEISPKRIKFLDNNE